MEETQKVSKNALKSKEMEVHDSSSTNGQDAADTSLVASDKEEQPVTDQKAAYTDFPEGGLRAWLVVAAASMIMAMSFGMVNSFGVYQTYYEHTYPTVSSSKISVIGSIQGCFTFSLGVPSTVCMYYVGPQMMVLIGGILAILSFMFLSLQNAVWQLFVIQGIMFGLGSGTMYIHATGVLFQYFNKRKALVQGIITAGASIAGVYWPIGVRELIDKVGFAWANRIIGFLYIPMTLAAVIFLKPRLRPAKRKKGQNFLRLDFSVLKNWRLQLISMTFFIFTLSLFPGLFYVDLFCRRLNVAPALQTYNVPIVNAVACFARILPGYLGDYFGRMNVDIIFLLATGILPLALWTNCNDTASTLAFCITWGAASGGPVCLTPAIAGQILPGKELSSCLAYFFFCGGIAALIGPSIGGSFIPKGEVDGIQGFDRLAIFVGILGLVSAGTVIALRMSYTRKLFVRI